MKLLMLALSRWAVLAAIALAPSEGEAACSKDQDGLVQCWGAVAVGPHGQWAYAIDQPDAQTALYTARKKCDGKCLWQITFVNTCGAAAITPSDLKKTPKHVTFGQGRPREVAINRAMTYCAAKMALGSGCTVRVAACTADTRR